MMLTRIKYTKYSNHMYRWFSRILQPSYSILLNFKIKLFIFEFILDFVQISLSQIEKKFRLILF